MQELISKMEFWVAIAFALVIKLRASKTIKFMEGVISVIVAVTAPLIFVPFIAEWMNIEDSSKVVWAFVALTALTGEHAARLILEAVEMLKPADIIQIVLNRLGLRK